MPLYECVLIARNDVTQQQVEGIADGIASQLETEGGEAEHDEGRKLRALGQALDDQIFVGAVEIDEVGPIAQIVAEAELRARIVEAGDRSRIGCPAAVVNSGHRITTDPCAGLPSAR